jgi:hypothetical protein
MAVGDVGEREFGEVGVDMEPAFLELAEALKWPHFGHTYSNGKGKRSVRMTEIRSINQQMPRQGMNEGVRTHVHPPTCSPSPAHCG